MTQPLGADAVVIDLRGNQGGSTTWGLEAATALWGEKPVAKALSSDSSQVWWRASPGNTDYVRGLAAELQQTGKTEMTAYINRAANGMAAALAAGQPYWVESSDTPADNGGAEVPALNIPVYVIVPGQCASACLDALDLWTHFPKVKLIGAPSSADSAYLEVRVEPLPDGLAKIVIPNKLYRNRPRRPGQGYKPAIEVDDLDWSTAAFQNTIETDLRTRSLDHAGRSVARHRHTLVVY